MEGTKNAALGSTDTSVPDDSTLLHLLQDAVMAVTVALEKKLEGRIKELEDRVDKVDAEKNEIQEEMKSLDERMSEAIIKKTVRDFFEDGSDEGKGRKRTQGSSGGPQGSVVSKPGPSGREVSLVDDCLSSASPQNVTPSAVKKPRTSLNCISSPSSGAIPSTSQSNPPNISNITKKLFSKSSRAISDTPLKSPETVLSVPFPSLNEYQRLCLEEEKRVTFGENLLKAAQKGIIRDVRKALDEGADVNYCDKNNNTALLIAANGGHEDLLLLLLDHGADVNCSNTAGITPLQRAVRNGNVNLIKMFMERGAKVNKRSLIDAVNRGQTEIVMLLMNHMNLSQLSQE